MTFNFNSELYAAHDLVEGVDYARRYRRHERFDDTLDRTGDVPRTTILAPHGGGIEPGTSELCLAVAGYHPADLSQVPPAGVTYDYWMFEGLRDGDRGNRDLHVTSTGCDDGVAVALCAGSLSALTLHGMAGDDQAALVGGCHPDLRRELQEGLCAAGFDAQDASQQDASQRGELDGNARCNIANRTLLGMGAQLELSKPLRDAMFTEHTRAGRKHTTTPLFWRFVAACRDVLGRFEAEQIVARPDLRCLGKKRC